MTMRTTIALIALLLLAALLAAAPAWADTSGPTFADDATPSSGTTGDPFEFRVTVYDPDRLLVVEVRYWYGEGGEIVAPMERSDDTGRNYTHTTRLPPAEPTLHYRFRAQDTLENWNDTAPRVVSIADNDPPGLLSDTSARYAQPGKVHVFEAEITDNTAVRQAWVIWRFDGDEERNLTLSDTHPMRAELMVPMTGVETITYRFEAVDLVGNALRSEERSVEVVMDSTAPEFGRDSSPQHGETGESYTFAIEVTDDLGLVEVRVIYRLGDGTAANHSLAGDRVFTLTIGLPADSVGHINYSFYAADLVGNWARTAARVVPVDDVIAPVALAGPDRTVAPDETLTLDANGSSDNIGVVAQEWSYEADGRTYRLYGPTHELMLARAGVYTVRLVVRDAADNEGHDEVNITVRAPDGPPDVDGDGDMTVAGGMAGLSLALAVGLAAAVAVCYAVFRRSRRRGRRPRRGRGSRSTSSLSQVGYSSTK